MDINLMIKHYKKIFKNPMDIFNWIEHDLKRMGLDEKDMKIELNKARQYLGV